MKHIILCINSTLRKERTQQSNGGFRTYEFFEVVHEDSENNTVRNISVVVCPAPVANAT